MKVEITSLIKRKKLTKSKIKAAVIDLYNNEENLGIGAIEETTYRF